MKYKQYRMFFQNGVHFGQGSLESADNRFTADTLFSALCHEAVKRECLPEFVGMAKENRIKFSDAFPFIGKELYFPKPMLRIDKNKQQGDSVKKKKFKKLQYVPVSFLEKYLKGEFPAARTDEMRELGKSSVKVSVSIRGEEETRPYRVGSFHFREGNGLYFILGYEGEEELALLDDLLEGLSFSGIGGKRSSGMGRFTCYPGELPDEIVKKLDTGDRVMSLSVGMPKDEELSGVLEQASYLLQKRSGFVASETYADGQRRKADFYVFQSGSIFGKRFEGDVFDVSVDGRHPVYRYAKPIFLEV